MNTENEKKWFVYIGDHHEGPLSDRDVFQRRQKGEVNQDSYVWREGMADWVLLSQVTDLAQAIEAMAAEEAANPQKPRLELAPEPDATPTIEVAPVSPDTEVQAPAEPLLSASPAAEAKAKKAMQSKVAPAPSKGKRIAGRLLYGCAALCSIGIFLVMAALVALVFSSRTSNVKVHARVRPIIERIVEKVPSIRSAFKMTPTLSDVSSEDMADLENARMTGPALGVKIGIGLSDTEPTRPAFYVTTNLPHRTKLELIVTGDPETLLNRLSYSSQVSVTPQYGFGKSEAFLTENGQPLPKGEYQVTAYESEEQSEAVKALLENLAPNRTADIAAKDLPKGVKFVGTKKFFLGGERDDNYLTRLKSFHDAIKEKAEKEIAEVKQYAETLNAQHSIITGAFLKLFRSKKILPPMRTGWDKTLDTWNKIAEQMDQTLQTWSKETLQNEFFYGKAYESVKNAFASTRELVKLEAAYVAKPADRRGFEIQHGKVMSESRETLGAMNRKVEYLSKSPKTPSGLPTREGL